MTPLREAAQQALEALLTYEQYIQPLTDVFGGPRVPEEGSASAKVDAAITTLRAALAEPVQEQPTCDECGRRKADGWALYCVDCLEPMFAQRKPLTEEEIRDLWSWAMTAEAERTATTQQHAFARAIERAHGIGGQE